MSNEEQPPYQPAAVCNRCGNTSEMYISNETKAEKVILCSDCCMNFIMYAVGEQWLQPWEWVRWAKHEPPIPRDHSA